MEELFGRHRLRWYQRRATRIALGAVLVVDLAVLGTDAFLLHNRSTTTVVDLQDALASFRTTSGGTSTTSVTAVPAGGIAVPGAATGEPTPAVLAAPTTVPGSTTSTPVSTSAPATPKAGALAPPQAGVYHYATTGGETVSLLGSRHDYPADTYAVIRHTGGCGWELRAEVVKEHVDRRAMCSGPDQLLQQEQQRAITFFGTTDGATITCDPAQVQMGPGDVVGSTTTSSCRDGKGTDTTMVRKTLAFGQATVDGVTVDTVSFRIDATMVGKVRGASSDIYTVVAATGLPIRLDRSVDTMADAFGASIRYQEHVTFRLVTLTPQT